MLTGLDNSEIYKWRSLIDDACAYVKTHTVGENLDEDKAKRLDMLCAIYAFKLYSLCNDDNITSFTAGDVQITSPNDSKSRADLLWAEYLEKSHDIIRTDEFLFGRVM